MGKIDALILARGGSKGIPKKNILSFCGIPLVGWSVIQAKMTQASREVLSKKNFSGIWFQS